jgi:hypothetical protein
MAAVGVLSPALGCGVGQLRKWIQSPKLPLSSGVTGCPLSPCFRCSKSMIISLQEGDKEKNVNFFMGGAGELDPGPYACWASALPQLHPSLKCGNLLCEL